MFLSKLVPPLRSQCLVSFLISLNGDMVSKTLLKSNNNRKVTIFSLMPILMSSVNLRRAVVSTNFSLKFSRSHPNVGIVQSCPKFGVTKFGKILKPKFGPSMGQTSSCAETWAKFDPNFIIFTRGLKYWVLYWYIANVLPYMRLTCYRTC